MDNVRPPTALDLAIKALDLAIARLSSGQPTAGTAGVVAPVRAADASAGDDSIDSAPPAPAPDDRTAIDAFANKALIKVARITECELLAGSEKLLRCQADLGGGDVRQVVAGLQQYMRPDQLLGTLVCIVANLKATKLAGEKSEAMILAADTSDDNGRIVRVLIPPDGSQPGDLVHLDGTPPPVSGYPKVIKDWAVLAGGLRVGTGNRACFLNTPLVTAHGVVVLPPEIHPGSSIR